MTFRELVRGITPAERRFVAGLALIAMLCTVIAPSVGWIVGAARGLHWNGVQVLAPGDAGAYFSSIAQASHGATAIRNAYATEAAPPTVNVFWQAVGYFAAVFRLTPVVAFYVVRTLLVPVLAAVAYLAVAHFIDDGRRRRIAFALFMFATGFGVWFAPFFPDSRLVGGSYEWPIDLWVGEAHAFTSMTYSPHFTASLALILAVVLMLRLSWTSRGRTAVAQGAVAGLLGALLFQFHPFHAPTLYAVGGAYLLFESLRTRRMDARWAPYLAFVALSSPLVLYHYRLAHATSSATAALRANLTLTPSPVQLVIGFGAIGIFAVLGAASAWRSGERGRFLVTWAVVQLALLYSPLSFQRRLIEGASFPLALLATAGIAVLVPKLRARKAFPSRAGAVLLSAALFLPSSFAAISRNVDAYLTDDPPIFFHDERQHTLVEWLRAESPRDAAFLSFLGGGSLIVGWGERTAYLGHWVNSGDVDAKRREIVRFFSWMSDEERAAFMREHGLTHVFVGPEERRVAGDFGGPSFELVYDDGIYRIYALRR